MFYLKPFKNICLIRRDNIGDLVCTTPAIKLLRRNFPEARIYALVNSYNAEVLRGNPDIDHVYVYHKGKHSGGTRLDALLSNLRVFREIRAESMDVVIGCAYSYSKTLARYTWLTGGKMRIGVVDEKNARNQFYYNVAPSEPEEPLHEVEAMIRLLAPLGVRGPVPPLDLRPDPVEVNKVQSFLRSRGFDGKRKLVALHISSRKPKNRWPKENFRELAELLQERFGVGLLLLWSPGGNDNPFHPGDDENAAWIVSRAKARPFALATTRLGELIAALSVSDMVVCCDGGAMHVAAGLGKPILTIWGSTDPRRWSPWGVPHRILQKERDAAKVTTAEALNGFQELFTGVFAGEYCLS